MTNHQKQLAAALKANPKLCAAAGEVAKRERAAIAAARSFAVELRGLDESTAAGIITEANDREATCIALESVVRAATPRGRK